MSREQLRGLGAVRIAVGAIFLVRTTPLFYLFPSLVAYHGGPLLGWPAGGWRFAWANAVLPSIVVEFLCVARTVAAVLFTLGIGARAAGVVASLSAYAVYSQEPFAFIFTLHVLYLATLLLAIGDATGALALRPTPVASPRSSVLLIRAFVISIYAWSAIAKVRPQWLSGYTLLALHEDGAATGALAAWLLATPASCRAVAWATLVVEASLPVLLWRPRTRPVGILVACALHAAFELTMHPDVFGWVMVALLTAFWPASRLGTSQLTFRRSARTSPRPCT